MTYYGVGEAYRMNWNARGEKRIVPPEFDKVYTSIVEARKEVYKRVMGNKGSAFEVYVYDLSNRQHPNQIGFGMRTIVNRSYKVVSGKRWVIWEPLEPRNGPRKFYYLNKDGTLGKKRE